MICNKDCEHCKYDDCINDEFDAEDYIEAERIHADILKAIKKEETTAEKRRRQRREAYRRQSPKTKERMKAYSQKYRATHKDQIKAYKHKYYLENKFSYSERRMANYRKNIERWKANGAVLKKWMIDHELSNIEFAALIGRNQSNVSAWRTGKTKIPEWLWAKINDPDYDPREVADGMEQKSETH